MKKFIATWLAELREKPWHAASIVVLLSMTPYLLSTVNNLIALFDSSRRPGSSRIPLGGATASFDEAVSAQVTASIESITGQLFFVMVLLGGTWVLFGVRRGAQLLALTRPAASKGSLLGAAAAVFAIEVCSQVIWDDLGRFVDHFVASSTTELDGWVGGSVVDDRLLVADWGRSITAGISEELILIAGPMMLARHYRWKLLPVATGLIAIRVGMHMYYGWFQPLQAILWVSAVLAIFAAVRSIWPLITGHIAFDVVVTTPGHAPSLTGVSLGAYMVLTVFGLLYLVVNALRWAWPRLQPGGMTEPEPWPVPKETRNTGK